MRKDDWGNTSNLRLILIGWWATNDGQYDFSIVDEIFELIVGGFWHTTWTHGYHYCATWWTFATDKWGHKFFLRNIDHTQGLCNGTRLIVTKLGDHVLEGQIFSFINARHKFFIPMLSLNPSDSRILIRFQRRQFLLMVSYTMTINKSQGQSFLHVELLLKRLVLTHG